MISDPVSAGWAMCRPKLFFISISAVWLHWNSLPGWAGEGHQGAGWPCDQPAQDGGTQVWHGRVPLRQAHPRAQWQWELKSCHEHHPVGFRKIPALLSSSACIFSYLDKQFSYSVPNISLLFSCVLCIAFHPIKWLGSKWFVPFFLKGKDCAP